MSPLCPTKPHNNVESYFNSHAFYTYKYKFFPWKNMYIRMLGEILLSEMGYLLVTIIAIVAIFYVIYLLFGDTIANDEDDDIDLWPQ